MTEPSGIYTAWKSIAIGKSSKTVREFLEKNYQDDLNDDDAIKLTIKSLLEVVQTGAKNIEISIMKKGEKVKQLDNQTIEDIVNTIEQENKALDEQRKSRLQQQLDAQSSMT